MLTVMSYHIIVILDSKCNILSFVSEVSAFLSCGHDYDDVHILHLQVTSSWNLCVCFAYIEILLVLS